MPGVAAVHVTGIAIASEWRLAGVGRLVVAGRAEAG